MVCRGQRGPAVIYGTCYRHIERSISIKKTDRLPSNSTLQAARGRILAWWHAAYFDEARGLLRIRFVEEARASLPGLLASETDVTPEDVFAAMELQRLRLRQDQQVPEWSVTATVPKTTPDDA